jgi:RNA polymerase sigma-70 factor (ECF subfamily)
MDPSRETIHERLLVARAQAGDERAVAELIRRYHPRVRYFVAKMLGGRDDRRLDDVLQDVWLDVLRSLPRLRDAQALPAWLYRIARDRVWRELRRAGVRATESTSDETIENVADGVSDEPAFDATDVALVHACLDELSPPHREVLVLRFLQEMTYEQVAAVARCDVGTVRSRLHYAKAALRQAMERKQRP